MLSLSCAGNLHEPAANLPPAVAVYFFIARECPIANSYAPEMGRIVSEYAPRGVEFRFVYSDPDTTISQARAHASAFALPGPVIIDADHALARRFGAKATPEAAVVGKTGAVLYCGRIDDRYITFGKRREEPTSRDLRDALDAILLHQPVRAARTTAVGCSIPL